MESQYGKLEQYGRALFLEGPSYQCAGEIRPDGKVFLAWTDRSNGRVYLGLYEIIESNGKIELCGKWGYSQDNPEISPCGKLIGRVYDDWIRPVVKGPS